MTCRTPRRHRESVWLSLVALSGMILPASSVAQAGSGREIFVLDPSGASTGGLPGGVRLLRGSVTVATRDGARMLKAATPAEILITLPEVLPRDFTLEFDIVPKGCCDPENDLGFEGTPTPSGSAHVFWHPERQRVDGGGGDYRADTPADIRDVVRGQLTRIVATFEGETFKLYTNGRRLYTLTERRFARGRVLRVFLGGQNEDDQAVYLARLRVVAGAAVVVATATGQSASTGVVTRDPAGGTVRVAGSTPAPATPVTTPTLEPRAVAAATGTGPVATAAATSPVTQTRLARFAPPAQRSIRLAGFTASGVSPAPSRTIPLTGFVWGGVPPVDVSRTLRLSGFAVAGGEQPATQRTIRLTGFAGAGQGTTDLTAPAARILVLPGFTGSAGTAAAMSRSIRLAAFSGVGGVSVVASRTIRLTGFTWSGGSGSAAPRIIRLSGWTVTGQTTTP